MKKIAVIGGGIAGVTTAYALLRRGYEVTLYESQRYAAMETSYANGGQLSASNAAVWNSWPTLLKGMRWLFTPEAPLLVNPKPSWQKISWMAKFVGAIPRHDENTCETVRLALAAREHLFGWAKEEGIDFDLKKKGILHIYRSEAEFHEAERVHRLLVESGLERYAVTPEEIKEIEPSLQGKIYSGYYTPSDATGDIHKYTQGLAAACERLGGKILYRQQVFQLLTDQRKTWVVAGENNQQREPVSYDKVVICAGVGSKKLAAQVGDHLPIYPVKGYSITVRLKDKDSRAAAPNVSLLDEANKLVSSRLGAQRLRVAGTAEFNGYNKDIRADRIQPLIRWVEEFFPGVATNDVVPWTGLRPMTPDMMPRVGPGKSPSVYYNTGHGHLGWTLAAATAEQVASMIDEASS
ncbi:D-amino-acid dehydrogenase [Marinospirillum celere]|uniref:D-amino-acid dehydrogenase n=1 Tax=Marinospirillum celere TaxID=1122252 RepID=A0A1I1DV73_9GAMM|nr:D-amino acid dehydrogenase [Marinospirillum celere]SFB78296.1 D-amino-acid dehydrogenase [Marinospirillum celere]